MEQRAVPVVRRVDGRFHQAAGGALAQPSFFFSAACPTLHYLRNATEQRRNEMAPKRFRLSAYKPTTWQLGVLPVAFGRIPRSYWLPPAVCQMDGTHRPLLLLYVRYMLFSDVRTQWQSARPWNRDLGASRIHATFLPSALSS